MKFSCYLFDLDNSLLYIPKPWEYFDNILIETIQQYTEDRVPEKNERNSFWGAGNQYMDLLQKWGVQLDNYNDFWETFDSVDFKNRKILMKKEKIDLFPDVYSTLKELKSAKKKMGLVSNTAKDIVDHVIKQFNLNTYIQEIFALGEGKEQEVAKPSPAGIQLVLKNLGINLNNPNALMVGDSAVDIAAAKHANIQSCLVKRKENRHSYNYKSWDFQPDYVIDSLNEITDL